jgi:HlyD family secretion protein
MNRKKTIIGASVLIAVIAIALIVQRVAVAKDTPVYRFAQVERGDLEAVVSATGTLNAVTTVAVGTQVSGQVTDLLVDFNDEVKKGQLLARIDPTLAQQSVTDAQANVEKVVAQEVQAQRDAARNHELSADGLIARSESEQTQSALAVARASVKSAQVALDRSRQNLSFTSIYSPIDGVIVERNVNSGQTVAASLSAPQLFLIANDLSHMQILAQVGESDIAQIKEGQPVKFTVQALPNQNFDGVVKQVRLQSATTENVVNYTVVVSVDNPKHQLLPGMTARANFLTKSAENVLKVPNAALRFHPVSTAKATTTSTATTTTQSATSTRGAGRTGKGRGQTVFVLDAKGVPQPIRVKTGLTDGTFTEVSGTGLAEGVKVITGTVSATTSAAAGQPAASPFGGSQQTQPQRGGGRGTGF